MTHPTVCSTAVEHLRLMESFLALVPTDADYVSVSKAVFGGTIGKHVRHALDHFHQLLVLFPETKQDSHQGEMPLVDYDARKREPTWETERQAASAVCRDLAASILRLSNNAESTSMGTLKVGVRVVLNPAGMDAVVTSTFERELWFAVHHLIHHQAMMSIIASELGIKVPPGFGVAPATANYAASR